MIGWLRRKDPALRSVRRAARVTLVACIGFYTGRYLLGNPVFATYSLFGAVALGALAQIPGSPRQRSRTLMMILPAVWLLVTLGTVLAVRDWSAALGMFVLGFAVSYAGVGGPRLVGVVNGLQLLYILPCFPPYAPGTLGLRLAGVTVAVVLLAIAERFLWPDPSPEPYEQVLARAVSTVAACLDAAAGCLRGEPGARDELARRLPATTDAAEALRPSLLDPGQRPASASRRDHALSQAASVLRYSVSRLSDLFEVDGTDQLRAPAGANLLAEAAASTRTVAAWLRGTGPVPDPTGMMAALDTFREARAAVVPNGVHPDRLRLGALALAVADGIKVLVTAAEVAAGATLAPDRTPPALQPGSFWYAYLPTWRLWWSRLRAHFTPRSVYFQGALRLAFALAVARLLAGVLDLSHGFWVLLAVLTLLRTSAAQTRMASWPILTGTVIGAVVAGVILVVVVDPPVYAIALPVLMLVGFSVGPLLGQLWGQAAFTIVIAVIFAQLAPSDWRLAEARVVDVSLGVAIGVLIGLFAWPRGGTGELHRAVGAFFDDCAGTIRETVSVLTDSGPPGEPGEALPRARHDVTLAEASYALYQSERRGPSGARLDWQAAMMAGHHVVRGAEDLLRSGPAGHLTDCVRPLQSLSSSVSSGYADLATRLIHHNVVSFTRPTTPTQDWPDNLGVSLYHLADLRVWLEGLADDLGRVVPPANGLRSAGAGSAAPGRAGAAARQGS